MQFPFKWILCLFLFSLLQLLCVSYDPNSLDVFVQVSWYPTFVLRGTYPVHRNFKVFTLSEISLALATDRIKSTSFCLFLYIHVSVYLDSIEFILRMALHASRQTIKYENWQQTLVKYLYLKVYWQLWFKHYGFSCICPLASVTVLISDGFVSWDDWPVDQQFEVHAFLDYLQVHVVDDFLMSNRFLFWKINFWTHFTAYASKL